MKTKLEAMCSKCGVSCSELLRPCLHGGGITLLEGSSLSTVFLLVLHERRDNPGVGINLSACWIYPSRRGNLKFLVVQAM